MNKTFFHITFFVCIFLTAALTISCQQESRKQGSTATAEKELYICPMHPQITSDKPGSCPICGMDLVKKKGQKPKPAAEPDKGPQIYICPMHPQITSENPKYKCPICGMDLVPKKTTGPASTGKKIRYRSTMNPGETSDAPGKDSMGMDMVAFEEEAPAGTEGLQNAVKPLAPIIVTADQKRLLGMTFGTVEERPITREIRTSARIVPDETRLYRVTTKIDGYVDELFVNVTGQKVKKGEPLLSVYSPELVASQEEFLTALQAARQLSRSSHKEVARGGRGLVTSARRRLKLWDISDAQIARLEKTGTIEKNLRLFAPAGGYVIEKNVLAGQKIMPGEPLLVIADFSTVWAEADIYESDLPYITVGMPVTLDLPYWPGKSFEGTVNFLNPFLDPMTRTLKARMNIQNPELVLKGDMLGTAVLHYGLGDRLAVPETAVMRTGTQTYVFVAGETDELQPVAVTIGIRADGYFEVLSGLKAGDRVVTSANFLIDSESSLKAILQAITGGK